MCLLVLNLSLIGPYAIMVRQEKPVSMTLTAAIAMATFSTYKIIIASVNLKRRKRTSNLQLRLLRVISFIDALVSVMTLQNTLIMVNSPDGGLAMRPLTAITSGAFWLAGVALSVAVLHAAIRNRSQDRP